MSAVEPVPVLKGRRIILGVSGSIAAYKAADLGSKLTQAGALVDTILTRGATQFVAPLTFQSVTGRPARTDADLWADEGHVIHVGLAEAADLVMVAPATANLLTKLALGVSDGLLPLTALATRAPVAVAPAMDGHMFQHPATQRSLETLRSRGVAILGPAEGRMASGLVGAGRMLEPAELFGHARLVLGRGGALRGRHVVVTSGPTREALDPVRFLSNRSSGKQGHALAQAALDRGANVMLVTGPSAQPDPVAASVVRVTTAREMAEAVLDALSGTDVLIMAAAVADYRPAEVAESKIKKGGGDGLAIETERTMDILAKVAARRADTKSPSVVVGFAAESDDVATHARTKLEQKGLDMIVANDIKAPGAGFAGDTNRVLILEAGADPHQLETLSKAGVAEVVLDRIASRLLKNA